MTDRENEILKAWHANGIVYEGQPYKKIFAFAQAIERQALERAAEQADMLRSKFSSTGKVYDAAAANQVRLAIRALIEQSESKEKQG